MSEHMSQQFSQYFKNRNFEQIPTDSRAVTMFGTFEANYLYLFNIIELDDSYDLDFERYLEYKQLTMAQFANNEADKTILLNIIISGKTDEIYEAFNYTPDLTEPFIDVIWLVDKVREEMVIPKKQLKNVLGIEKDLKALLKKEKTTYYALEEKVLPPYVTYGLIGLNILLWLYTEWVGSSLDTTTLVEMGAMKYDLIAEQGQYYRIITAMFLHIGVVHLFHNMISLYIFGSRLEKFLSKTEMLTVYLLSGATGSLASLLLAGMSGNYPVAAGASGAVYGLMGGLLFVSRTRRRPIEGMSTYILWLFFVLGIVYSVTTPNVDIMAHVGGFLGGIIATWACLAKYKKTDSKD